MNHKRLVTIQTIIIIILSTAMLLTTLYNDLFVKLITVIVISYLISRPIINYLYSYFNISSLREVIVDENKIDYVVSKVKENGRYIYQQEENKLVITGTKNDMRKIKKVDGVITIK